MAAAERAGKAVRYHTGSPEEMRAASLALDVPSLVIQPGNRTNGQKHCKRKHGGNFLEG